MEVVDAPANNARPKVFWAGRMDAQKRIELVYAIARALPDVDFCLWGEAVMGANTLPATLPNMTLQEPYAKFADVPLRDADMWLYTAAWDGIPQMLLEVGMTGVPVVASTAGGTPEVIREGLGTLMPKEASVGEYVVAIKAVLADAPKARHEGQALRASLMAEHTKARFAQALNRVLDLPADAPEP